MSRLAPTGDVSLKSVLVATDFSEASDKPVRHALTVARHFGAKFYLAHVVSSVGFTIAGAQALELASSAALRDVQQLEKELLESGALAGLPHEFMVRQGNIWEELEKVIGEKQVDLVVIGTHGRRGMEKLLLGSVAEQIFRQANGRVLTVGPHSLEDAPLENTSAMRPFLFPTDFSEASLHALPHAISFSNHFGAKLVLLHVAPVVPIPEGFNWSTAPDDVMQMREDARVKAIKSLEELVSRSVPLSLTPEFVVEFGKRSENILRAAHTLKTDLIVMGLNRSKHADAASRMPWSTAYKVVCGAHCSVLTVRSV